VPYGAVDHKFWTNGAAKRLLNDTEKLAFLYLLTSPHSNMIGFYRLPLQYMAHDLEWTVDEARDMMKRLCQEETGPLVMYDYAREVVLIPAHLKYNSPGKGNREAGAMSQLDELPPTPLHHEFWGCVRKHASSLRQLQSKAQGKAKSESSISLFEVIGESPESGPITAVVTDTVGDAVDRVLVRINELREKSWNWARYTPLTTKHDQNVKHLGGRLSEGCSEADLILIAEYKAASDGGDEDSRKYFTPNTLYNTKNFEGNLALARDWDAKGRPSVGRKQQRGARGRADSEYAGVVRR